MSNILKDSVQYLNELRNSIYISVVDQDPSELVKLHQKSKTQMRVTKSVIKEALGPSSYKGMANWQIIYAQSTYRPDVNKVLFTDSSGTVFLNSYHPPEFLNDVYWDLDNQTLQKTPSTSKNLLDLEELPLPYFHLFSHLTSCEGDSLQYLIDWMSVLVNPSKRNITTLTLIGRPGAGKGLLFEEVLAPLVGRTNAVLVRGGDSTNSRFNAPFLNKRLIMLDEVKLKDPEAIDRFKTFANPVLEIEQKGKDPIYVKNWANTIITSNNLDSIYIEPGDRRFSIIQLTDKSLELMVIEDGYGNIDNFIAELRKPEFINKLHNWLIEHTPSCNMNIPFRAPTKTADVKNAGYAEWERALIECLNQNVGINFWLSDLQDKLTMNYNVKHPPGRSKIKRLLDTLDNAYSLKQDRKTGKSFITVNKPYNLPTSDEMGDM